jgi:zinc protease
MRSIPVVLATLLAACSHPRPAPPWTGGVVTSIKWHLADLPDNGLRVIVLPEPSASTVSVVVHRPVGGKDDPAGKGGLAHLAEHVMFLVGDEHGTVTEQLDQIAVAYNATTSIDATTYYQTVLPGDLDAALGIEATRMRADCRAIDAKVFANEREVVLNELRLRGLGGDLDPAWLVPGIRLPGGTEAEVAAATLDDVCGWVEDHYSTINTVVVVAGAVEIDDAVRRVIARLGPIEPSPAAAPAAVPELAFGGKHAEFRWSGEQRVAHYLFPLPTGTPEATDHARQIVSMVGTEIGGIGRQGWLHGVEGYSVTSFDVGRPVLDVALWIEGDDPPTLRELAKKLAHFRETRSWGVKRDTVTRERVADKQMMFEDVLARAMSFADLASRGGADEIRAALQTYTMDNAELRRAVAAATDPAHGRYVELVPDPKARLPWKVAPRGMPLRGASEVIGALHATRGLAGDAAIEAPGVLRPGTEVRELTLPNGLAVHLERTRTSSPMVTAALVIDAGHIDEPWPGAAEAAAQFAYAPHHVTQEDHVVTDEHTMFVAADVGRDLPSVLAVMAELAYHPRYVGPQGYWRDVPEGVDDPVDDENSTMGVLRRMLFGKDHPYARDDGGAPWEAAMRNTVTWRDRFYAFRKKHYRPSNAKLFVAGNFDIDKIEEQLDYWLGDWGAGEAPANGAPAPAPEPGHVAVIVEKAGNIVELRVAYPTTGHDEAAREVLARVLEGRATTLREQLGVAYAPEAGHSDLPAGGYYQLRIAVDARYGGAALTTLRGLLDDLRANGPTAAELRRAQRAVVREAVAGESTTWSRIYALATDYALRQSSDRDALIAAVIAMTPEDVRALAAAELAPAREIGMVSGERGPVERAYREAGFKIDHTYDPAARGARRR